PPLCARLRRHHRVGSHRRGDGRRGRPQGVPRGAGMSAAAPSPQPSTASRPLLELRDVEAGYGPFRALFGVSFTVREGSVLALLGSNGGGKTTVARVCSGLLSPTHGEVLLDGKDMSSARPYRYARAGVVHAPEGRSVFASLTVEENLLLTF